MSQCCQMVWWHEERCLDVVEFVVSGRVVSGCGGASGA